MKINIAPGGTYQNFETHDGGLTRVTITDGTAEIISHIPVNMKTALSAEGAGSATPQAAARRLRQRRDEIMKRLIVATALATFLGTATVAAHEPTECSVQLVDLIAARDQYLPSLTTLDPNVLREHSKLGIISKMLDFLEVATAEFVATGDFIRCVTGRAG